MLASTTDALNSVFRDDVGDVIDAGQTDVDKLWKDREVYRYMTEAADAVAKEVEGIYRKFTLAVVAAQQVVPISRAVLHIREIRSLTTGRFLDPMNINDASHLPSDDYGMQASGAGIFQAVGRPSKYVRDYERCALLLVPIPVEAESFEMQCTATLSVPLIAGLPMPFHDVTDQKLMLLYMKHLAYAKHDANTLDLTKSKDFKKQFDDDAEDRKSKLDSYRSTPRLSTPDW